MVVVVENFDGKRANKLLPRTTVLDKIRADFAPKQGMLEQLKETHLNLNLVFN